MPKIIFKEESGDATLLVGGFVVKTDIYFISTIYCIDHSFNDPKLFHSKRQTEIFSNEEEAINFAQSWKSSFRGF